MKKYYISMVAMLVSAVLAGMSPALADYTAYPGHISWTNQGGNVYDSAGVLWTGDGFSGTAGTALTTPPYEFIHHGPLELTGDGRLALVYRVR